MTVKTNELKKHLKAGRVYRRSDLLQWSNAIDRHLNALIKEGYIEKLSAGIYYVPKQTIFGKVPPTDEILIQTFLKENNFLLTSPNAYNSLGVGTTQLYNVSMVYNHKRHGEFDLGGRKFLFHVKHRFPKKTTPEFLLIDLVNNIQSLAEDHSQILKNVLAKAAVMDSKKIKQAVLSYGTARAKALFAHL